MPPADFEIWAHVLSVSKMPSIESSFMCTRKHDDICGVGVPALKSVGLFFFLREGEDDANKRWIRFRCLQASACVDAQGQTITATKKNLHKGRLITVSFTQLGAANKASS